MATIITDDFLLQTKTARTLYHDFAEDKPIIDYHNHLPPADLANDTHFENLTQAWLKGDHYKWRAMRANGVNERYITGDATDEEKFLKWAGTVPGIVRNPLFHWTCLELKRYFDIDNYLDESSAESIYHTCNDILATRQSARQIPINMNVMVICTTDDPADSLEHHQKLKLDEYPVKVLPTFRPDNVLKIDESGYEEYILKLEQATNISINSVDALISALQNRVEYFDSAGCKLSDHGLKTLHSADYKEKYVKDIFQRWLNGNLINPDEAESFKSFMLHQLGKMYFERGWTQQFHLGAIRNNNSRIFKLVGVDSGVDSIGDFRQAENISRYLDKLDLEGKLAQTILYNLNPADNEVFATMAGNFQDGNKAGKIQWGSGWWFLDQKDGIENQLNTLSNMGLIGQFVGMLTDSRSFLSFPRHEYFRRVLCNTFGNDVENGELPNDMNWLGGIISNICFNNAKAYFGF